MKQNLKRMMK